MKTFSDKVKGVVKKIRAGQVLTYKEVAQKAGNSKASRAVASIMKANFDESIPCHRVIRSDGYVGGYNRGGSTQKEKKLKAEGVTIKSGYVIRQDRANAGNPR
jgi:O-6-methylguanine DNA methyltransferase